MTLKELKLRKIIRDEILNEVLGGEAGAGNPVSIPPDVKSSVRAKSVELANKHAKDAAAKTGSSISAAKKEIEKMSPEDKKEYLKGFGSDPSTKGAKDPKERAKAAAAILDIAASDPASGDELNAMVKSNPNLRTVQSVPDMGGIDRAAEEKAKIDNPNLDVDKKPGQVWKQIGKIAKSTGLAERKITIVREGDVKDHFSGSPGSKYELSSQGTYISHVPSMQEDDENVEELSESLKYRRRVITILR